MVDLTALRTDFRRDGYAVVRGLFAAGMLARMTTDFDRIVAQLEASGEDVNARWGGPRMERLAAGDSQVVHTHGVEQYSAVWSSALFHEPFLDACEALLGPDVVLHHTKLFRKPPRTGPPFPLHQDWSYFPTQRDSMIAAVIHISESCDAMGGLRVVPGSHVLGRAADTSGQGESDVLDRYALADAISVEAAPGDVLFFHAFTLHGSLPNTSDNARKTVLVQLYDGRDDEDGDASHPNARLVLRGWNHRATRSRANQR